ncbi:hypothetical protein BKA67DRAFT_542301 [Truncatella angustata]|uniref:Uncharacterized protein n=1 Tax=Truncatella angustata TaxID=152316 RepID=A0A9P8RI45_9PEZI|nr:uncharacterized protein BKA67DRAFT_542301 [Truncatella angustata]KAH6643342.1 hypothetical protein BKA67DRAFT_542301 [Truncatella angustata]
MDSWRDGIKRLREKSTKFIQEFVDLADVTNEFEIPEYEAVVEVFHKKHLSLTLPWSLKEVRVALDWFAKDATTYGTMFVRPKSSGTTLLSNGTEDEAQDVAMQSSCKHMAKMKTDHTGQCGTFFSNRSVVKLHAKPGDLLGRALYIDNIQVMAQGAQTLWNKHITFAILQA